ncbi:MAG TPA: MBOAT family O-acyltransferase [Minicystis sp.]|nr:MBOAT family O-acyltransferase [Minicystis sp.]
MAERGATGGSARSVLFAVALAVSAAAFVLRDVAHPYTDGLAFNTVPFLAFFAWFYVLYHFVAATRTERLWLVTVGSLLFYASWGLRFVPLVLATGLVDFFLAQKIAASASVPRKKALLTASVTMNLAVLAGFKYTNFFLSSAFDVARFFGGARAAPVLDIAMPIGISFYTFQAISYTVDVYRGVFEPRRELHEFVAGLTFFPHLVAGPIVRSSYLLPQFERPAAPSWDDGRLAYLLIATGLLNKTLADLLAAAADPVFASREPRGALETWTAVLAFGGQVYGDFCGYTDMATGIALLLGFKLPPNFDLPYLSRSPAEFWRRWHISLSNWLRDYLWFPLARKNPSARYLSLLFTMLLAGLWHGAAWTFVIWGTFHGVLLVATHAIGSRVPRRVRGSRKLAFGQWLLTTYLVFVGFAMFRAANVRRMVLLLREMHSPLAPSTLGRVSATTLALVVAGLAFGHALSWLPRGAARKATGRALWPVVVACLALSFMLGRAGHAFLYFQF